VIFIAGDLGNRGRKLHWADLALDLTAEGLGQGEQTAGRESGKVTFGQLGFHFTQLFAQGVDADIQGRKPLFLEALDIDGALVLDLELEPAAPVDERGFGDFQILGDAGEAPA